MKKNRLTMMFIAMGIYFISSVGFSSCGNTEQVSAIDSVTIDSIMNEYVDSSAIVMDTIDTVAVDSLK